MHMAHDDTSRLRCVAVTCLPKARLKVRVLDQCEGGGPYLEAQSLQNCSNSKLCMWQMQKKPPQAVSSASIARLFRLILHINRITGPLVGIHATS